MLSEELFRACWKVLNSMLTANNGVFALPFLEPVSEAQVPGYHKVIKHPMDVGKIKSKLGNKPSKSKYDSVQAFRKDVELMLSNALTFNRADKDNPALTVYGCAKNLKSHLSKSWKANVKPLLRPTCPNQNHPDPPLPPPAPPPSNKQESEFDYASCKKVLAAVVRMPEAKGFYHEPTWEELYVELIEEPLALETVERLLENGTINSLQVFTDKVRTVFANCLRYFVEPVAHKSLRLPALTCLSAFNDKVWKQIPDSLSLRPKPGLTTTEWEKCGKVMESVLKREGKMLFVRPPDKYGGALPNYNEIIKEPIHLGLVQQRLHLDRYATVQEFGLDVTKVFQNCITYNVEVGGDAELIQLAKDLLSHFEKRYKDKIGGDLKVKKVRAVQPAKSVRVVKATPSLSLSLNNQAAVKSLCKRILKKLMKSKNCMYFLEPVDWKALNLPHYPTIIKHPMDLGTVKKKLDKGEYQSVDDFAHHVRLVFKNCLKFNQQETPEFPIRTWAKAAAEQFETMHKTELLPLLKPSAPDPPPIDTWSNSTSATAGGSVGGSVGVKETPRVPTLRIKTSKKSPKSKAKASPSSLGAFPQESDCKKLVERLMKDERALSFNAPFDYTAAGLLDYPKVVKKAMDFLTIKKKLNAHGYPDLDGFVEDMELVFSNCLLYNKDQSPDFPIRTWCEELREKFRQLLDRLKKKHAEKDMKRAQRDAESPGGKVKRSTLPKTLLLKVLEELSNLPASKDFRTPVPWKELGLDDYLDIVKNPMDLQTVRRKLTGNKYASAEEFASDVRLVFSNCLLYNPEENPEYPIRTWAKELLEFFERGYKEAMDAAREKSEKEAEKARLKALKKKKKPKAEALPPPPKPTTKPPTSKPEPTVRAKPATGEDLPPPPPPPPPVQASAPMVEILDEEPTPPEPPRKSPTVLTLKRKRPEETVVDESERVRFRKEKKLKVKGRSKKSSPLHRDRDKRAFEAMETSEPGREWELVVRKLLDKFRKNEWALYYFDKPVLELFTDKAFHESYLSVVSQPMDLQTVYKKLFKHRYESADQVLEDMELIFKNAEVFNSDPTDPVACNTREAAQHLRKHWLSLFHESQVGDEKQRDELRKMRDEAVASKPLKSVNVMRVLKKLFSPSRAKVAQYFMELYDWERFNKPDYPLIVKRPMALSIVKANVNSNKIKTLGEFAADVRLIFANCLLYNKDVPDNKFIRDCAISLSQVFENAWGDLTVDVVEKMGRKAIKTAYEESKAPAAPLPAEEEIDLTDDDDDQEHDYVQQAKPKPMPNPMLSRGLSSESLDLDAKPVRVGAILAGSSSTAVSSSQRGPSVSPQSKRMREELSNGKLQDLEKSFLEGAAVAARQALKRSKKVQEERLMNAKQAERRRKRELEQEQAHSVSTSDLAGVAMNLSKSRRRKRARPLALREPEEGNSNRNVRAEIKWKQKTEHFFQAQRNVLLPKQHKTHVDTQLEEEHEVIKVPAHTEQEDREEDDERSVFCVWERVKVGSIHFILGRLYIRKTAACELGLADGFSSKAAKVEKGQATLDIEVRGRGEAPLQARAITEICLGHVETKASHLAPLSLPLKYMTRVNRMRKFLNDNIWIPSSVPGVHLLYTVDDVSHRKRKAILHERDAAMQFLGVGGNFSIGFCGEKVEF